MLESAVGSVGGLGPDTGSSGGELRDDDGAKDVDDDGDGPEEFSRGRPMGLAEPGLSSGISGSRRMRHKKPGRFPIGPTRP